MKNINNNKNKDENEADVDIIYCINDNIGINENLPWAKTDVAPTINVMIIDDEINVQNEMVTVITSVHVLQKDMISLVQGTRIMEDDQFYIEEIINSNNDDNNDDDDMYDLFFYFNYTKYNYTTEKNQTMYWSFIIIYLFIVFFTINHCEFSRYLYNIIK